MTDTFEEGRALNADGGSLERTHTLLRNDRFQTSVESHASNSSWFVVSAWLDPDSDDPNALLAFDPTNGKRREWTDDSWEDPAALRWRREHPELVLLHPDAGLDTMSIFDLASDTHYRPEFDMPVDVSAEDFEIGELAVAKSDRDGAPRVWISGRSDDTNYVGLWTASDENPSLREARIPYESIEVLGFFDGAFVVTDRAYVTPGGRTGIQGGCAIWLVPESGEPTCRGELRHGDRPDQLEYLGAGWTLLSTWGVDNPRLLGPEGEETRLGRALCEEPFALAWRTGAPGVVTTCFGSKSPGRQEYEFWSPDDHFRFEAPRPDDSDRRVRSRSRVRAIQNKPIIWNWWGSKVNQISEWFDFRRGVYWSSPPLRPLGAGSRRSRTPLLAADERDDGRLQLFALDFDEGERRDIATYEDCPGTLREHDRSEQFALVHCVRPLDEENSRFERVWSDLLDLHSGARYRIDGFPHAVYPGGAVVVSNRSDSPLDAYESADELWVVEPVADQ